MERIELVTSDLQFVALVEIIPFQSPPEVVIWGSRVFMRRARPDAQKFRGSGDWYVEAFAVVSLTPSPGFDKEGRGKSTTEMLEDMAHTKRGEETMHNDPPPPVDRSAIATLHGTPVDKLREEQAKQLTGQHGDYIVLSDEERAKGFVSPVRNSYRHVGLPGRTPAGQPVTGCGSVTRMGQKLAETYARDPGFYSATFCTYCNKHFPVGAGGEFVWEGTDERVGT